MSANSKGLIFRSTQLVETFNDVCINKAHSGIRITTSKYTRGYHEKITYDYFDLDENGFITKAPRGFAVMKGAQITELDKLPPMIVFGQEV